MSLDDRVARLLALFDQAAFPDHMGMHLRFDEERRALVDLEPADHLNHGFGDVHGGVIATLIDTAAWFTAAVRYDAWLATVEFQTRLLEPAGGRSLTARGALIRAGRSLAVAEAEVHASDGSLIALGSATLAVTGLPLPT